MSILHIKYSFLFILWCRHEQREVLKARFEVEMQLRKEKKLKKSSKKHGQSRSGLRAKEPKQNKTMRAIDELKAKRNADKQKKAAAAEADQKKQEQQQQVRREPLKVDEVFSESSAESEGSSSSSEEESDEETKEEKLVWGYYVYYCMFIAQWGNTLFCFLIQLSWNDSP